MSSAIPLVIRRSKRTTTAAPPSTETKTSTNKTTKMVRTTKSTTPAPESINSVLPTIMSIVAPLFPNMTQKNNDDIDDYSKCGRKVGGGHPWIAILEHTNPKGRKSKRTLSKGVLIHPQYVLTTVSSIHNSYPFWVV